MRKFKRFNLWPIVEGLLLLLLLAIAAYVVLH